MAQIRTIADPRVVDESGVVLNQYVGPLNWEHYQIPASGLSDTQITFANLVTLGTNRIYDSNFQVEYTIQIDFGQYGGPSDAPTIENYKRLMKFNPFPLHWVCDQLRVNVNGSACMSRPQESLFQRMLYWRQSVLDKTCSFCPHTKAPMLNEPYLIPKGTTVDNPWVIRDNAARYNRSVGNDYEKYLPCVNMEFNTTNHTASITFREPVLCPPFNQRLDKIYQRPIFNVTSIDIVYQLNDLRKMILPMVTTGIDEDGTTYGSLQITEFAPNSVNIHLSSAKLCFNVASLPPGMTVPPVMTMPYYDHVCYVTQAQSPTNSRSLEITSGVYTLAQVPTAIYIFVGPNQLYRSTVVEEPTSGSAPIAASLSGNYLCPIRNINITMGNNTQLLNTTSEYDRYQMALANGLEDCSWEEFTMASITAPGSAYKIDATHNGVYDPATAPIAYYNTGSHGNRCCLRLIPGIDLLIPDRRLVGGMDADQMVFQVKTTVDTSAVPAYMLPYLSLWIMFEYCGVLTIEPVHATIDMIPIKTMPLVDGIDAVASPTVDAAEGGGEGTANPEGAGIFSFLSKIPSLISNGVRGLLNFARTPSWARDAAFGALGIPTAGRDTAVSRFATEHPGILTAPVDKAPAISSTTGGTIIGSGKLGKFYT